MPDPEAEQAQPADLVMPAKVPSVVVFVVEKNGEADGDGERSGVVVVVPWKGAAEDKQPET